MTNYFAFEPDLAAKKIHMIREFNAPVEKVWKAFTDPDLLKQWIAPKPWTVVPKIADFAVGGVWQYIMVGTEGQEHWVYDEFTAIETCSLIESTGAFCDEEGNPNMDGPKSYVSTKFSTIEGNRTRVETLITLDSADTIKWFVEGGFKEGTAMTYEQLDEILALE
ncbi:SRPBCC domain-containing protein [Mucilaginibacter sp.]